MGSDIAILLWPALLAIAVGLIIYSLIPRSLVTIDEDLAHVEAGRTGLLRLISPFLKSLTNTTVTLRQFPAIEKYRQGLDRRIVAAGLEDTITTEEFMALHVFGGICGAVFGALIGLMFIRFGIPVIAIPFAVIGFALAIGLIGAIYPKAWLDRTLRNRHKQIFRALPYTLDLLTVSVEAGLDFMGGLQRVARETPPGPLRDEIKRMLRQVQLGKTRVDVLRQMSDRVKLTDLTSVCAALIQATQLGASLGPTLRLQADQMRVKRSQRAEKLANEAPVKMLLPLLLFIFPSIFIIILGPIALRIADAML